MQVFASWAVKLPLPCLKVDLHSGLSTTTVKPVSNITSSSLNERSGERVRYIFLYDIGEVVNLSKEGDPTIISSIMIADLLQSVEPLLGRSNRQKLLKFVFVS